MKRFLPFIGIFLVTTITAIYWFEIKKDKDRAENLKWLEERCSKPVEESFGRNVFLEPPAIEEKFDDFDNTITWKYEMNSWNRVPNQFLRTKFCPDRIPNSSAYLDITCTKYSDKSGKYDLTFKPPANIENNAVEIKWDDMPPKRLSVDRFGTFSIFRFS